MKFKKITVEIREDPRYNSEEYFRVDVQVLTEANLIETTEIFLNDYFRSRFDALWNYMGGHIKKHAEELSLKSAAQNEEYCEALKTTMYARRSGPLSTVDEMMLRQQKEKMSAQKQIEESETRIADIEEEKEEYRRQQNKINFVQNYSMKNLETPEDPE